MSYDKRGVLLAVRELLSEDPRATSAEIARHLQIHPQTIENALACQGTGLRELRWAATADKVAKLRRGPPPKSLKQVAAKLGFPSLSALSHYLARRPEPHS